MRMLWITGDDYTILQFEQNHTVEEALLQLENNKRAIFEGEDYYMEVVSKEFGEVDPKFIDFVQHEIQDYDDSKHTGFIILKEENQDV